jgi:hypothetical protein
VIVESEDMELLLEHEQYKQFIKSTDLYLKHPEKPHIPVQAHYHQNQSGKSMQLTWMGKRIIEKTKELQFPKSKPTN